MTINDAMLLLARQPNALFVGQSVKFGGTAMFADLDGISDEQRIEFPVAEDLQLGFCTGLAIAGYLPICIFPRMDFMLRAADQLVNHLDQIRVMSRDQFTPKIIMRTRVGKTSPLNAGPQHTRNHILAFRQMLRTVAVWDLHRVENAVTIYQQAISCPRPVLVVETF